MSALTIAAVAFGAGALVVGTKAGRKLGKVALAVGVLALAGYGVLALAR